MGEANDESMGDAELWNLLQETYIHASGEESH